MTLRDEYRSALDHETQGRPSEATLEKVLRAVERPSPRRWRVTAVALACATALALLVVAARPRDEVFHLAITESTHPESAMELEMHQKTSRFPVLWSAVSRAAAVAASLVVSTAHAEPAPTAEPAEPTANAAPSSWSDAISSRRVSLEFKGIHVGNFFRIAADVANINIFVDKCAADRQVDLKVMNVPIPVALEAVRQQLGLSYAWRGEALHVACGDADARRVVALEQATLELPKTRLTVELKDSPVEKVFELLGQRDHVRFQLDACVSGRTTTLRLKNLPVRDIAVIVAESAKLDYRREGETWRVSCVR